MSESNSDISGDGRLIVLLFFVFGLWLFDYTYQYDWSFFYGTSNCNSAAQLSFVSPNKLVVKNYSDADNKHMPETFPAMYAPFFFELIPINRADKDMLMSVKGIGPALADDIIKYRQQFGPFTKSVDLEKITGIGPKRAAKFATEFTFAEVP